MYSYLIPRGNLFLAKNKAEVILFEIQRRFLPYIQHIRELKFTGDSVHQLLE